MDTEKEIHTLIPPELYHYGEWCVWDKEIAQIWLDYFKIKPKNGIEDYFYNRNKKANKTIVERYEKTPYLNFIRYFSTESNLDLSETQHDKWRVHE